MAVDIMKLRKILLLRELSEEELSQIAEIIEEMQLSEDKILFSQGDSSDAFYIVLTGELEINKIFNKKSVHITNVSRGSIIGEMGFITDSPRTATIKALTDVEMLKIPKEQFNKLMEKGSLATYKVIYRLSYTLCFRLDRMSEKLAEMVISDAIAEEEKPAKKEDKKNYLDYVKKLFSHGS